VRENCYTLDVRDPWVIHTLHGGPSLVSLNQSVAELQLLYTKRSSFDLCIQTYREFARRCARLRDRSEPPTTNKPTSPTAYDSSLRMNSPAP
jgi:hypothetical protein